MITLGLEEGKEVQTRDLEVGWDVFHGGDWKQVKALEPKDGGILVTLVGGDGIRDFPDGIWIIRPCMMKLVYPDGDETKIEL